PRPELPPQAITDLGKPPTDRVRDPRHPGPNDPPATPLQPDPVTVADSGAGSPVPRDGVGPPAAAVIECRPGVGSADLVCGAVHGQPAHRRAGRVLDGVLAEPITPGHHDAEPLVPLGQQCEDVELDTIRHRPDPGPARPGLEVDPELLALDPRRPCIEGAREARPTGERRDAVDGDLRVRAAVQDEE